MSDDLFHPTAASLTPDRPFAFSNSNRAQFDLAPTLPDREIFQPFVRGLAGNPALKSVTNRDELYADVAYALRSGGGKVEVAYRQNGHSYPTAVVTQHPNGFCMNTVDVGIRKRDPNALMCGDAFPTSKRRFDDVFGPCGLTTAGLLEATSEFLRTEPFVLVPFRLGPPQTITQHGKQLPLYVDVLLAVPQQDTGLAYAASLLQPIATENFSPRGICVVASPFYKQIPAFDQKQAVLFSRDAEGFFCSVGNCPYPGPSIKKGGLGYAALLFALEQHGLTLNHASAVLLQDDKRESGFMHSGPSGSGKSELLGPFVVHDGQTVIAHDSAGGGTISLRVPKQPRLVPLGDDMAVLEITRDGRTIFHNAENGTFTRTNESFKNGDLPVFDEMCRTTNIPLAGLNMLPPNGDPMMPWHKVYDQPDVININPRIFFPNECYPDFCAEPREIQYRSFGIRSPRCTNDQVTYGVTSCFNKVPWQVNWLWELVSLVGSNNPSIQGAGTGGVGSYEDFLIGSKEHHAAILANQLQQSSGKAECFIVPNQNIGRLQVAFSPQCIYRQFMFEHPGFDSYEPAGGTLLGFIPKPEHLEIFGQGIPDAMRDIRTQLTPEAFAAGYAKLEKEFRATLATYDLQALRRESPVGYRILDCFLNHGGKLEDLMNIVV